MSGSVFAEVGGIARIARGGAVMRGVVCRMIERVLDIQTELFSDILVRQL